MFPEQSSTKSSIKSSIMTQHSLTMDRHVTVSSTVTVPSRCELNTISDVVSDSSESLSTTPHNPFLLSTTSLLLRAHARRIRSLEGGRCETANICTVKIHKPNENVSWKSMAGCGWQHKLAWLLRFHYVDAVVGVKHCQRPSSCRHTVKNMHKERDGLEIVYTCGSCSEDGFIEDAFECYRLVSRKLIYIGRVSVTAAKLPRQLAEYKARHMRSLQLHPAQKLRFMLLSGHYVLGPEMVNNGVVIKSCCVSKQYSGLCLYFSQF
jgi:hypothetical protein